MTGPHLRRLAALLSSPFVLAAIPSLVLFFSIPIIHHRYRLDLKSSTQVQEEFYYSYCDLDGDGNSETIIAFDQHNSSGINIYRDNKVLNQWNVDGSFSFSNKSTLYIPADCNKDGVKEIYLFSLADDSVLLHCIPGPDAKSFSFTNRLVDVTGQGIRAPDPYILAADPEDLDGDGFPELIFGISTGFSKQPRKIYAYNPVTDSLISSPQCGGFLMGIIQHDLDHDGFREIMPFGYAAGNIGEDEMKHHDQTAWLTVLDSNLQFIFDPVELGGSFTMARPMIFTGSRDTVAELLVSNGDPDSTAVFWSFSMNGSMSGRTPVRSSAHNGLVTVNRRGELIYALIESEKGIVLLDKNKQFNRWIEFNGPLKVNTMDIDLDGSDEILASSIGEGTVTVYRPGFIQPAVADIGPEMRSLPVASVIYRKGEWPQLFLQSDNRQLFLEYRPNNLYYASFVFYPLVYAAFIAFVLLIQFTQKRALARKEEERRKIEALQLALIRNQLDPHFTLNALNSVLYLVEKSEKEKARDSLLRFSGLYRDLLLSAGKTRRSLEEEIAFCREYLALEKLRFGNSFDCSVDISPDINQELTVPKLIIQLYAENAVKHGLSGLKKGGRLEIRVSGEGNELRIDISDNGIGRARAAEEPHTSTGKGMKVMNELFDLYRKYYGDIVSCEITDLHDNAGKPSGTLASVRIQYRSEKVIVDI